MTARNTVWCLADGNNLVELTAEGRVLHQFPHQQRPICIRLWQRNADTEFFYLVTYPSSNSTYTFYRVDKFGNRHELPRAWQPTKPHSFSPLVTPLTVPDYSGMEPDYGIQPIELCSILRTNYRAKPLSIGIFFVTETAGCGWEPVLACTT